VSILKLEEEQAKGKKNKSVTFIEPVSIISKPEEIKDESDEEDFAFDLWYKLHLNQYFSQRNSLLLNLDSNCFSSILFAYK